jgi:hypothetical protein
MGFSSETAMALFKNQNFRPKNVCAILTALLWSSFYAHPRPCNKTFSKRHAKVCIKEGLGLGKWNFVGKKAQDVELLGYENAAYMPCHYARTLGQVVLS